jgi:UDP-N-acetylmuramoylalanine--D-glutamate ligase
MVWDEWSERVINRAKAVVLFGDLRTMMADLLTRRSSTAKTAPDIVTVAQMPDAVRAAAAIARKGDVVLLAPGGTSYDAFADFAARGEAFRQEVGRLADSSENVAPHS